MNIFKDYWSLTKPQLIREVQARQLTAVGTRKADLVWVLAAADHPMANPLPNIRWQHLSDHEIEEAIDRLGFQFPPNHAVYTNTRQGHQQFLSDIGIQAWQCLNLPQPPGNQAPPAPAPHPKVPDLNKQGKEETVREFFTRLEGFLAVTNAATDNQKLQYLYSAANKDLATFVTSQVQGGITDFDTIKTTALGRFEPSFMAYLAQFQNAKKRPAETFTEYGYRLRSYYLGYLKQTEDNLTAPEAHLVRNALVDKITAQLSFAASRYVTDVLLREPDLDWHSVVVRLEAFASVRRTPDNFSATSDTTSQFRSQAGRGQGRDHQPRQPHKCFVCQQPGHLAPQCPSRHQGNGNRA